jgi:hypothetical protein
MTKNDIQKSIGNLHLRASAELDRRVHERIDSALAESGQGKIVDWRLIMKNNVFKLMAAAIVILAAIAGLYFLGWGRTSVAWAEVARKVEQTQNCIFRMKTSVIMSGIEQTTPAESLIYMSPDYGSRTESYISGKLASITYFIPAESVFISVIPEEKKYIRMVLPADKAIKEQEQSNPRQMIMQMMSVEYQKLGSGQIDGIDVEGIEAKSPRIVGGMFEDATARLWVDKATDWPVRLEIEGTAAGGAMQMKMVMDDFQWGIAFEPGLFEPNIPSDYTSQEMNMPQFNEETAVQSLRAFAEIADSRYPSSLALLTIMKEMVGALKAKYGDDVKNKMSDDQFKNLTESIFPVGGFYAQLVSENKEPAYYGDKVAAQDADAVLMR